VGQHDVVNVPHFLQGQIANAGARVDQDIAIQQE
jgi:hypothetical protein